MNAARLTQDGPTARVELRTVAVPFPGPGQVLIRVSASPIHPADLALLRGTWGVRRPLPTTPGFEGAGEVVSNGGGILARWLQGRRVAFLSPSDADGAWAEYVVADATSCLPLWPGILDADAATLILNPLTALTLLDAAKARRSRGVLVTAGAGALGRMLVRVARRDGLAAVAVVRDAAQLAMVPEATEVYALDDPDLDALLRRAVRTYRVTVAYDAIGGSLTGRLLAALPDGGEVWLHGGLRPEPATFDVGDLVFHRKSLHGFWLPDHLGTAGLLQALPRLRRLAQRELHTQILEHVRLADVPDAIARAAGSASRGKILIVPTRA
jgi:NADPH2:quinone reductase